MKLNNHGELNQAFLNGLDDKTKDGILSGIGQYYEISTGRALEEVTDREAEHLLDYIVGPRRHGVSVLMQKHGLRYLTK